MSMKDGTRHYIKKTVDNDNRCLRIVVNELSMPKRLITAFFDRERREEEIRKQNSSCKDTPLEGEAVRITLYPCSVREDTHGKRKRDPGVCP